MARRKSDETLETRRIERKRKPAEPPKGEEQEDEKEDERVLTRGYAKLFECSFSLNRKNAG